MQQKCEENHPSFAVKINADILADILVDNFVSLTLLRTVDDISVVIP